MPNSRLLDGAFLGASLVTLYGTAPSPVGEAMFLLPWLLVLPFLDSVTAGLYLGRRRPGPGTDLHGLRGLHRACGYTERTGRLIRACFGLQCALAGYTLLRTGSPGWVSILALVLLTGLYTCWFAWRHHAIVEAGRFARNAAGPSVQAVPDGRPQQCRNGARTHGGSAMMQGE